MIDPRSLGQANLADNLRPHMQRGSCLLPLPKREIRPKLLAFVIGNLHLVTAFSSSIIKPQTLNIEYYSRLIKSENERFTLSNVPRASFWVRWKACEIRDLTLLIIPPSSSLS